MISVFDLDHTLLKENSSFRFGLHLYQLNEISFFSLLYAVCCYGLHKAGPLSIQNLHQRTFNAFCKGSSLNRFKDRAVRFVEEHVSQMFYEPALQRLKEARDKGHRTILLSSSPDFLIASVAEYLNFDEWAATPYLVDQQQRFCALGPVLSGEAKKKYLDVVMQREGIARESVYAYTDSHLDLPLLEAAGHPVGVNPGPRLRSICQRRGWEII